MQVTLTYTHKGWFGLCPVFIGGHETDCPTMKARHWTLEWLFDLSAIMMGLASAVMGDPGLFRIEVGAKLPEPIIDNVEA